MLKDKHKTDNNQAGLPDRQAGVSLFLVIAIMTVLLSSVLGLNTIYIGQLKTIKEMGNSVVAFYAADAGIEEILLVRTNPLDIQETTLSNEATYQVTVTSGGVGGCAAVNYCIKSIGRYGKTSRAIEIRY